jgi:acyl-CoA thioesterase-1
VPKHILVLAATVCAFAAVACGGSDPGPPETSASPVGQAVAHRCPLVVFLGDSLTAGYGLGEDQAYPAVVQSALEERNIRIRIVNAGVSGDTTAGGVSRLDWLLRQAPDVVVVGLGANDGLRGLPLEMSERNLREIVTRSLDAGAGVLLTGMKLPPNYGPEYTSGFEAIYPKLAEELDVPLMPFLLEGVAADPKLNLPDGIHPNAQGQRRIARNVLLHLEPLLWQNDEDAHRHE